MDEFMDNAVSQVYQTPKVLATYDAGDILAEAETGSVIIIVS